jgi:hypothetical protein
VIQKQERESPFACNAAALNTEDRKRWLALLKKLAEEKQEVRELPDGYAFRFAAETSRIEELAEFISYERLCCPFFELELKSEREVGPLWLKLAGRGGVKQFIRSEFKLP